MAEEASPAPAPRVGSAAAAGLVIRLADFDDPRVVARVETHARTARAATDRCSAHALDVDDLKRPGIRLWTASLDGVPAGIGALKQLSATEGEIKSMYTAPEARRSGIGQAILDHLVATARAAGLGRLSLETGSMEYFEPARALYRSRGFVDCPPFGDYREDPNSVSMTLVLAGG